MWAIRVIARCMGFGIVIGVFFALFSVEFEYEHIEFSLKGLIALLQAALLANAKLAVVLAVLGAIIGLIVGIVKVAKGEQ